jgi:hypothetical protein
MMPYRLRVLFPSSKRPLGFLLHEDPALIIGTDVMANPFLAISLALHLTAASGASVPILNVLPSCRAAASAQLTNTDRLQACVGSEGNARDQLVKEWTTFTAADRSNCVRAVMHFEPTYTELLTCLEIANDARKLPKELY